MGKIEKRFALLIDSDNVSSKYISKIINELNKYGIVAYKRIYGDWTSNKAAKWKEKLLDNSITPIQQFSNTVGKNATDSALIIDAMDILYTNNVEGFCIVSSDSDFTRLAIRLRESGMDVIGMGEKKTPQAFISACNIFTNLEVLIDQVDDIDNSEVEELIDITNIGSRGKNTVSNRSKDIIEKAIIDIIKENRTQRQQINNYIVEAVIKTGKKGIGLSELSNSIRLKYDSFNLKDYGYSTFSKFIQSINKLELIEDKVNKKRVKYKKI